MKLCPQCYRQKPLERFYAVGGACKDCRNAYRKQYVKKNREYVRMINRASRNGIPLDEVKQLLSNHDGFCICGKKATDLDHCHTTGKLRGLLCRSCNLVLGHIKDNPLTLDKLAVYLRSHV